MLRVAASAAAAASARGGASAVRQALALRPVALGSEGSIAALHACAGLGAPRQATATDHLVDDLDELLASSAASSSSPAFARGSSSGGGGLRAEGMLFQQRGLGAMKGAPAAGRLSASDVTAPAAAPANELESTPLESFAGLSAGLKARLRDAGISALFPVQRETVERVLKGEDIVVRSRTGSGKTLGFAIPVCEVLTRRPVAPAGGAPAPLPSRSSPRCIVLTPTRELAKQVEGEFKRIAGGSLRSLAVYGGAAFGPQAEDLRRGVDIVVGTPGRVMDHLERGTLDLRRCQFAILDEADEMLRMGFKEDVETIYKSLPPKSER